MKIKELASKLKEVTQSNLTGELTPTEIVKELNKYVIGQESAKKSVAIALRNRSRRKCVSPEMQKEISPKNILMIGNTGVGKTEIARRLADLVNAPFVKVEATKFTEVGYVGRDVESIIRDLLNITISHEKSRVLKTVQEQAHKEANQKILNSLLPLPSRSKDESFSVTLNMSKPDEEQKPSGDNNKTREKFIEKLKKGELEDKMIEIEVKSVSPQVMDFSLNNEDMNPGNMIKNIIGSIGGGPKVKKKMKVAQAREVLKQQIADTLIDMDKVHQKALENTQNMGIVFIDEFDKIVSKGNSQQIDISRQGVQRDLLPLVEGSAVNTRHGVVHTNHILFIAAGAFHTSSVSDIIPELQGRFPIRVELNPLTEKDFLSILTEPKNSLIRQYQELMKTEGIILDFTESAVKEIAKICQLTNTKISDIGARRLSTIMEKLLEDILFQNYNNKKKIPIDDKFVQKRLNQILDDEDLSRYIL